MHLFEYDLCSTICTSSLQFPVSCTHLRLLSLLFFTNVGYTNIKTMVGIQIADGKILEQDIY